MSVGNSAEGSLPDELEEALLELRDKDRPALLLRFLEEKSLAEVGVGLGVSGDTAQKRVAKALEALAHHDHPSRAGNRGAGKDASARECQVILPERGNSGQTDGCPQRRGREWESSLQRGWRDPVRHAQQGQSQGLESLRDDENFTLTDQVCGVLGISAAERVAVDEAIARVISRQEQMDLARIQPIADHLTTEAGPKTSFKVPEWRASKNAEQRP